MSNVVVVGAGLAGSEAAWQLTRAGFDVVLYESRPAVSTPAHQSADFAELVCSNSLGSAAPGTAKGLLVAEMECFDSMIVAAARETSVAAGKALAVDRQRFAARVTEILRQQERIEIRTEEVVDLPDAPAVIATGPLTGDRLAAKLAAETGSEHLHFYDATSPIVADDSIDRDIAFLANRRSDDPGDYLNCPLDEAQYERFVQALNEADLVTPRGFEDQQVFEGCMPIEQIARRGFDTLRFGPMRPVGLTDPRTGRWPYAAVQLRREDAAGQMWNLVGFQTRMTFTAQRDVLRLIPGLERAEFLRHGVIHRNTYVDGPRVLARDLSLRNRPGVRLAGQLVGVEGYLESAAMGLWVARLTIAALRGEPMPQLPAETILGALTQYVVASEKVPIQPMNANFGLLPPAEKRLSKRDRKLYYHERSLAALRAWLETF
ncbi:MAG: methylenetetrahydrofolate--tRNA-(uracil(54)-C(5))-methyltransferase (FADH(2)-oxidizing) TrmFO [Candidatus Lernaella stagnicola]|nr:methylenetetrahydrofolate--tRNA-(uracil(54)-C(5))-methyltransferase (FADH(2)-oxidizing) TrmFO [Candidatus Lernaella stagnicola]